MERRQGYFLALKEDVLSGLSPLRSRSKSPAQSASPISDFLRRKKVSMSNADPWISRSGSLRPVGETLTPLMEGPLPEEGEIGESKRIGSGLGQWVRGQLIRNSSMAVSESGYGSKRSDLRLLLGVMGAPVAPVHAGYKCGGIRHGSVHTQPRVRLGPYAVQIKQKNI